MSLIVFCVDETTNPPENPAGQTCFEKKNSANPEKSVEKLV